VKAIQIWKAGDKGRGHTGRSHIVRARAMTCCRPIEARIKRSRGRLRSTQLRRCCETT